jgi:phosphate transport system substrate-binding protein
LKSLWEPAAQGKITQWNQIRSNWPAQTIELYGPGLDSGTYDYFAEVVVGSDTRSDYVASEDDEVLAAGVGDNPNALGYFGLAYYDKHQDSLKALAIDSGSGAVAPIPENVVRAQYIPLPARSSSTSTLHQPSRIPPCGSLCSSTWRTRPA